VGLVATIALAAALAGPRQFIFRELFVRYDGVGAAICLAVLLGAWALTRSRLTLPSPGLPDTGPRWLWLAGLTTALLLVNQLAYHGVPLAMDEYAPLLQARAFASGHVLSHVAPGLMRRAYPFVGVFFTGNRATGDFVSTYWPGHALLEAPFTALGLSGLLNAAAGAATTAALFKLAHRLAGPRAAWWSCLLWVASPAFIVTSASFYAMPLHLLASLTFAILFFENAPHADLLAGAVGGLALNLHQPLPHALFAAPLLLSVFARPGAGRRLVRLGTGYVVLGLVPLVGWVFARGALVGDTSAVVSSYGSTLRLPDVDRLIDELILWGKVLVWFGPGVATLAFVSARRPSMEPMGTLWGGFALSSVVYLFVAPQGHGWGPRYLYPVCAVLFVEAGRTLSLAPAPWRRYAGFAALLSLATLVPYELRSVDRFISAHLRQRADVAGAVEADVVFVRTEHGYYAIDLVQNDPVGQGGPLVLGSRGPDDEAAFVTEALGGGTLLYSDEGGSAWRLSHPEPTPGR
jgi:hypothetical protein